MKRIVHLQQSRQTGHSHRREAGEKEGTGVSAPLYVRTHCANAKPVGTVPYSGREGADLSHTVCILMLRTHRRHTNTDIHIQKLNIALLTKVSGEKYALVALFIALIAVG